MNDITDGLASWQYRNGSGALQVAIDATATLIDVSLMVTVGRMVTPGSFPGSGPDPTLASVARRIVGQLMAAGWTPPEGVPLTTKNDKPHEPHEITLAQHIDDAAKIAGGDFT